MNVVFADGSSFDLGYDTTSGTTFNYLTPTSIGGTVSLHVVADGPNSTWSAAHVNGLAPGASSVAITLRGGAVAALPVAGGTGINTSTEFRWTRFEGGVHLVRLRPTTSSNPEFLVVTSGTSTRIPDLAAQGLGLPTGNAAYEWDVTGIGPYASVDAYAAMSASLLLGRGGGGPSGTMLLAGGPARAFTTQ